MSRRLRAPLARSLQTLLDNTLTGGLQVLPPGSDEWLFVKVCRQASRLMLAATEGTDGTFFLAQPLEGCIVVNLADLLSIFSGGIL